MIIKSSDGSVAENADFGVLGLKSQNLVIFMQKLVFAAQITIFRPRSPTINNPQGIFMVWGVAGAEKCENYMNSMMFMKFSWIPTNIIFY